MFAFVCVFKSYRAIDGFKWLGKMMLSIKRKKKSLFYLLFFAFSDSNSVIVKIKTCYLVNDLAFVDLS